MKVEFIECSARGNKGEEGNPDINDLEKWLAKIAWAWVFKRRGREEGGKEHPLERVGIVMRHAI